MAPMIKTSKPAPQKPQAAPAKPGAVRPQNAVAAAPAKPAPAKPAPAKPPSPAPAKPPAPAQAKPAQAKSPQAAPPAEKAKSDFAAQLATLVKRVERLESSFYGPYVKVNEKGEQHLDLEGADRKALRNWAWQFGYDESVVTLPTESIRNVLVQDRGSKPYPAFTVVRDGFAPAEAEEPAEQEAGGEEEEELIDEETIQKMNWSQLTELAERIGLEYGDIKNQPKVLRSRILTALAEQQEGGEEEAPAEEGGEEEGVTLEDGMAVIVTSDGQEYPATFRSFDADGDAVIEWADGDQVAVNPELLSLPAE